MIDQTNFETWFLMYADNELSAAEKLQVEEFLKSNPSYQLFFDQVCRLKFKPVDIVFPDKELLYAEQIELKAYTLKPDQSITYPSKEILYRKVPVKKFKWAAPIGIAASLFFLLSLFYLLNTDEKKVLNQPLAVHKTNTLISPVQPQEKSIALKNFKHTIIAANGNVDSRSSINAQAFIVSDSKPILSDPVNDENEVASVSLPNAVQSNLSEEAIKAAASRNIEQQDVTAANVLINTDILIEASNRNEDRTALRGLVRKITRRIFKEKASDKQQQGIEISNFVIPVSNKQ